MAGLPPALEGRIRLTLPKGETVAALTPASAPRRRLVHEVARLILAETSDEAKQ
jgi:hypothetical protein